LQGSVRPSQNDHGQDANNQDMGPEPLHTAPRAPHSPLVGAPQELWRKASQYQSLFFCLRLRTAAPTAKKKPKNAGMPSIIVRFSLRPVWLLSPRAFLAQETHPSPALPSEPELLADEDEERDWMWSCGAAF
jgi:hypothetical protein